MDAASDIPLPEGNTSHAAIEKQLEFMRALVDSTVDAIVVHRPDGSLVFFNQGVLDLLGLSAEQVRNLPPYGWIANDHMAGAASRLERIIHERRHKFESAVITADGRKIPTEVTASRFDTNEGPLIVAVIRDVTDWAEAQEKMRQLAYRDSLTGLPNRAAFAERLAAAIASATRYRDLLMLAYLDLDRFKPVNDHHGHQAGDDALKVVAERMRDAVRLHDLVARLGGDEFVIVLQRVDSSNEISRIAERVLAAVREPIRLASGQTVTLDASMGFSVFDPDADDARSLVVKADVAMYAAKRAPDTSWLLYETTMGTAVPNSEAPPF